MTAINLTDIDKHNGLMLSEDVKQICQPLTQAFGFSYFHYFKSFDNDNTCISLSTHPEWICHRYEKAAGVLQLSESQKRFFAIWDFVQGPNQQYFKNAANNFNIQHGITVIERNPDSHEFYHFAISKDDPTINDVYVNEMKMLDQFLMYFKSIGHQLITTASQNKMKIPSRNSGHIVARRHSTAVDKRANFLQKIQPKKIYFEINGKQVYITSREFLVTLDVLKYKPVKKISTEMNISTRTVEAHVRNVYRKLGLINKHDLARCFSDNNLI